MRIILIGIGGLSLVSGLIVGLVYTETPITRNLGYLIIACGLSVAVIYFALYVILDEIMDIKQKLK